MATAPHSLRRALSIAAVLTAAITSPGRVDVAHENVQCNVCGPFLTCPAEFELPAYDQACQAQCGYGTYAGACSTVTCSGGTGGTSVYCYYIQ